MGTRSRIASYALCFLVIQVKFTISRTSWRLSADKVVMSSTTTTAPGLEDDAILNILTSSISLGNGQGWSRTATDSNAADKLQVHCSECKAYPTTNGHGQDRRFAAATYAAVAAAAAAAAAAGGDPSSGTSNLTAEQTFANLAKSSSSSSSSTTPGQGNSNNEQQQQQASMSCGSSGQSCDDIVLDCGKPVNFTYYDNLIGVANRNKHPLVPEPAVVYMFKKTEEKLTDFDIDLLERRLKRAKREKPKSVQLYNQIGNFWRIKGNAQRSIECFRRALAVSPHNAEVLLNLARVLLVLEYLDDASYLARRSLELQPPDRNAWEQYLTLGQIFKAYGHFQEAAVHLRHALELKPDLVDAAKALKEVESLPIASMHMYTLLIIVCLVLGVLLVVLSNVECEDDSTLAPDHQHHQQQHQSQSQTQPIPQHQQYLQRGPTAPSQRHFNRAMAMRSLRFNVSRGKRC
ncbi:uncharacterized protein LOC106659078 [Trichogramma pretiosum]|uniref:uncharacterized protein LOC106659078 n=1 Tax=Trichogramma pretiosum TaxID=7493 RepID=UPI0006C96D13|nr:uncharacterized protein LOC106659078 [Trichogramma pretiosum]